MTGADLEKGLEGWLDTPFRRSKKLKKKCEKDCEYYDRNKAKNSGQVPLCNFNFVVLLVCLV